MYQNGGWKSVRLVGKLQNLGILWKWLLWRKCREVETPLWKESGYVSGSTGSTGIAARLGPLHQEPQNRSTYLPWPFSTSTTTTTGTATLNVFKSYKQSHESLFWLSGSIATWLSLICPFFSLNQISAASGTRLAYPSPLFTNKGEFSINAEWNVKAFETKQTAQKGSSLCSVNILLSVTLDNLKCFH